MAWFLNKIYEKFFGKKDGDRSDDPGDGGTSGTNGTRECENGREGGQESLSGGSSTSG